MELIISAFIGAFSAIVVAVLNKKRNDSNKDKIVQQIIEQLNINHNNVYIVDSSKQQGIKYKSEGSQNKSLIILK
tara:strand:+ start:95 stop:319 length:225 start_codon:yes stop_codon:yes gene_type:complete